MAFLSMLVTMAGQWAPRHKAYLTTTSSSGETFQSMDDAPLLLFSALLLVHRQTVAVGSRLCKERAKRVQCLSSVWAGNLVGDQCTHLSTPVQNRQRSPVPVTLFLKTN